MTTQQLEALAIYRNHNGVRRPCACDKCQEARAVLKESDRRRES